MPFGWGDSGGHKNHVLEKGLDPQGNGQYFGLSGSLKSIVTSLVIAAMYAAKVSSTTASARLLRLHCSRLARATPSWKTYPCDAACCQNYVTTCTLLLLQTTKQQIQWPRNSVSVSSWTKKVCVLIHDSFTVVSCPPGMFYRCYFRF